MTRWPVALVIVVFACGSSPRATTDPARPVAPPNAQQAMTELRALVGRWTCTAGAFAVELDYRLVSSDSVLVETYRTKSGKETLTLFHLDGPRLLATHYCGQGNQPRLVLASAAERRYELRYRDATNLASPAASHLARLELALADADHFAMVETYEQAGKPEVTSYACTRVASP